MFGKRNKRLEAVNRELLAVQKQERKLAASAKKAGDSGWKRALEDRIPEKVYAGLESAFTKAFGFVFEKGTTVIEKGYSREQLQADHAIRNYAVQIKGGRKELKKLHKGAGRSDLLNLAVTTAEGIGLGALGVGMPDIVLFLGTLLKGIYETALSYGCDYTSEEEKLLILKMIQTSLSREPDHARLDEAVDRLLLGSPGTVPADDFQRQLKATASAMAMDMLLLKFIQGLPVVGIVGGAANPVYYRKVMQYVQLKYRKRYLLKQKEALEAREERGTNGTLF